ncbi:hypothetical protein BH23CHL5_BH23CHL5_13520 [soil metagenome]
MSYTQSSAGDETKHPLDAFRKALLLVLDETFVQVHGLMLDRGTSFFETLATIAPEEASTRFSNRSAPLSAQVNHTRYYIDILIELVRTGQHPETDWDASWNVAEVTEIEWQQLISRLRTSYEQLREIAGSFDRWDADSIAGAFALVGHSLYHLGEIRQGLGFLRG